MNARHQQIPLHRIDRYLLCVDSRETPMHTASLNVYRLPQDDPDFVLPLFQRLKTYPVTAGPFNFRVDRRHRGPGWDVLDADEIDTAYLVRHSAVPRPGTDDELATLVGIVGAYGALPHFERIAPYLRDALAELEEIFR